MASVIDIVVGLNHTAVDKGMEHIREQVGEMKKGFTTGLAEFASVGFLVEMTHRTLEYADKVANLSEQFGVSGEALQRLSNVAKLNGVEMETVGKSYNKLILQQQEAIKADGMQRDAFQALGISVEELKKSSPEELFNRIADATVNAKDRGETYANVVALMGKSAGALYPILEKGSAAIREQGDAMGVLNDDTISALDNAGDEIAKFEQRVTVVFGNAISYAGRAVSTIAFLLTFIITEAATVWNIMNDKMERAQQLQDNLRKVARDTLEYVKTGKDVNAQHGEKSAIDGDREDSMKEKEAAKKKLAEDQKKRDENRWKYLENAADSDLKMAKERMSVEEKMAFLAERIRAQKVAIAIMGGNDGSEGSLANQKSLLADVNELAQITKSEDARKLTAAKTLRDQTIKYQEDMAARESRLADEGFERKFRALKSEGDKREALVARQKELEKELRGMNFLDYEKVNAKSDAIQTIKDRIADMDNGKSPQSIKADSLARIGGGGNVSVGAMERQLAEQKEANRILKSIDKKLGGDTAGTMQP